MRLSKVIAVLILFLVGGAILSAKTNATTNAFSPAAARAAVRHKVIAPPGLLNENLTGITLLFPYGSYSLYALSPAALESLPDAVRSRIVVMDEMDRLLLDAYPFDTQRDAVQVPLPFRYPEQTGAPGGPMLQLIQFVGPIREEWLAQVEATGARLVHYVANNGYLVWADAPARTELSRLAGQGRVLQFSAPYQPYFKVGPSLFQRLSGQAGEGTAVPVVIQMLRHANSRQTEALIEQLLLQTESKWEPVLAFQNIVGRVRVADIAAIAARPDVVWVGERMQPELLDEVQGQILAANFNVGKTGPSGPGYLAWLSSYGFSTNPADYPIVDITDDGIGVGSVNSGDPTLHLNGDSNNATRLAYVADCTAAPDGGGTGGHGHLNVSIAGGYDMRSGSPYQDSNGFQRGMGINPFGRFAGTRIFSPSFDLSQCGGNETGLIKASYNNGARISNNSWGCSDCIDTYDASSQAYDVGVRDADLVAPGNQEFIILFSAGNSGPNPATIGTPGNAKNVITVGASESDRPTWTDGCGISPSGADNVMDVIRFSSRGPAPGGRVKPDVIAPGTHIQGTVSPNTGYSGSSICDPFMPLTQTVFAASSGTSHSTPAVAGVASLTYYWLENHHGMPAPSPALMKAYLIAHPTYLTGAWANDTLPSNSQGYGMPDMTAGLDDAARLFVDQSVILGNSGDKWILSGAVTDPSRPVRVVLAYTDKAGLPGTSPQVNDLNLTVDIDGQTYLGNQFSGQWSVAGGTADAANNVEAVFLPAGTTGSFQITVTGFNIADDGVPNFGDGTDQDFALVCTNCSHSSDFTLQVTPISQNVCAPADAVFDVFVGQIVGYSDPVTLSAVGEPAGTAVSIAPNPAIPPSTAVLTVTNTGSAAPGSYNISVVGVAPTSTHTTTVALNLSTANPAAPALLSPVDGAMNQPTALTLAWAAATQALTYTVEIATDSSFTNIVEAAAGLTGLSYSPANLATNTQYFWRVRPGNACGSGPSSEVYTFITARAADECPIGSVANTWLNEDFESGGGNWTQSAGQGTDLWSISAARAHSGGSSFLAQDVTTISDQYLVSPSVTLPAGQSPLTLQFWNYQALESSQVGCFDGGILEISTDGGIIWTQLDAELLTDPYDGMVSAQYGNPIGGRQAWCGDPQGWLHSVADLDAFAGSTVQFRFRLGTDQSVGREGWYVDDVAVQSCQVTHAANLGPDSVADVAPGGVVTHTFSLANLGLTDSYTLTLAGAAWPTQLATTSPLTVSGGMTVTVQVRVTAPLTLGQSDSFTLTVTSRSLPAAVQVRATGVTNTRAFIYLPAVWQQAGGGNGMGATFGSGGSAAVVRRESPFFAERPKLRVQP